MTFGGDLAHRVRPRSVVGRPLRTGGGDSMVQRTATFGALLGLSHLQRRSLIGGPVAHPSDDRTDSLAVRPPADWWPQPVDSLDDEPSSPGADRRASSPAVTVVPTGDRKLDALRRMLAANPGGVPTAMPPVRRAPAQPTVPRGLPRALRHRGTSAGPATAPGGLAGRLQPQTIDPDAIPDVDTARTNGTTGTRPEADGGSGLRGSSSGAAPRSSQGSRRSSPTNDPAGRLQRTLERTGLIPSTNPPPPNFSSGATGSTGPVARSRPGAPPRPSTDSTVPPNLSSGGGVATLERAPLPMATAIRRTLQSPPSPRAWQTQSVALPTTAGIEHTDPSADGLAVRPTPAATDATNEAVLAAPAAAAEVAATPSPTRMVRPAASGAEVRRTLAERHTHLPRALAGSESARPLPRMVRPTAPEHATDSSRGGDDVRPATTSTAAEGSAPRDHLDATQPPPVHPSPAVRPDAVQRTVTHGAALPDVAAPVVSPTAPPPGAGAERTPPGVLTSSAGSNPTPSPSSTPTPSPSTRPTTVRRRTLLGRPATRGDAPDGSQAPDLPDTTVVAPPPVMVEPADVAQAPPTPPLPTPASLAQDRATSTPGTHIPATPGPATHSPTARPVDRTPRAVPIRDAAIRRVGATPILRRDPLPTATRDRDVAGIGSRHLTPVPSGAPDAPDANTSNGNTSDGNTGPTGRNAADTSVVAPPPVSIDPAARFLGELGRLPPSATRPLPIHLQPLASAIAGDRPVRMSTAAPSQRALASVGKVAATTGDVIHLQRIPTTRHDTAVLAHELTHVAHPSPAPRFFDDDRHSPEERRAEEIADIIRRSPVLPRATAAGDVHLQRKIEIGGHRRPSVAPPVPQGTVSADMLASSLTQPGAPPRPSTPTPTLTPTPQQVNAPVTIPSQSSSAPSEVEYDDSTTTGFPFPYNLRDTIGTRDFVDWLMEQLGDRMMSQLEQRGGRFRGEF